MTESMRTESHGLEMMAREWEIYEARAQSEDDFNCFKYGIVGHVTRVIFPDTKDTKIVFIDV